MYDTARHAHPVPARPARRSPWWSAIALLAAFVVARPATAQNLPAPLADWMHSEQQLLSRAVDESRIRRLDNHQDRAYAPEEGRTFTVESYWVDADRAHVFTADGLDAQT